MIDNERA